MRYLFGYRQPGATSDRGERCWRIPAPLRGVRPSAADSLEHRDSDWTLESVELLTRGVVGPDVHRVLGEANA